MSTVALYKTGLGAYAQGKDALAMLFDAPRMIAGLIAGISELALRLRPLPRKWSVTEIITHVAEDELVTSGDTGR